MSFSDNERLTCVNLVNNAQQFTYYASDINVESQIDHFIITNNLLNYVNSSDVRDDIDNHSDHLTKTMYLPISIHITKIASSNIRQFLPIPKWFCVNKETLQKYQSELDQQLGSIPLNEFTCDHIPENYNCQIQVLHEHLIHLCVLSAERITPFTKPYTKEHRNKVEWIEHVSKRVRSCTTLA